MARVLRIPGRVDCEKCGKRPELIGPQAVVFECYKLLRWVINEEKEKWMDKRYSKTLSRLSDYWVDLDSAYIYIERDDPRGMEIWFKRLGLTVERLKKCFHVGGRGHESHVVRSARRKAIDRFEELMDAAVKWVDHKKRVPTVEEDVNYNPLACHCDEKESKHCPVVN